MQRLSAVFVLLALGFIASQSGSAQGLLTPPGAPAPTMKTLDQVEPRIPVTVATAAPDASSAYVINAPGSYYLQGNVSAGGKVYGISIQAVGVTLDLAGYTISGGSTASLRLALGARATVSGGGLDAAGGAYALRSQGELVAEDLVVRGSADYAVLSDAAAALTRCHVSNSAGGVYLSGGASLVADCVIRDITAGPAVVFRGSGSELRDSVLSRIDLVAPYSQAVDLGGSGHRVLNNRIGPVGGRGILASGASHEVKGNHIVVVPSGPALEADSKRVVFRDNSYDSPGYPTGLVKGTDGGGNVAILSANTAPTAVITAPSTVGYGLPISLSGGNSYDAESDVLTYGWTITQRPAAGAGISGTGASVTVPASLAAPLAPGVYTFQLIVTDAVGAASAPTVAQIIVTANQVPTALLDQTTASPRVAQVCVLTGERSSDDGSIAKYTFTLIARASGSALPLNTPVEQASPVFNGFTPDVAGIYQWRLVVQDNIGNNSSPHVLQVVAVANQVPTAVLDQTTSMAYANQVCVLSGSRSSDTDGSIVRYTFTLIARPAGSARALNVPVQQTSATFNGFTPDVAGQYQWRLVVRDDSGNDSSAAVLTVVASPTF